MSYLSKIRKSIKNKRGYAISSGWFYTEYVLREDGDYFIMRLSGRITLEVNMTKRKIVSYNRNDHRYIRYALGELQKEKIVEKNVGMSVWDGYLVRSVKFKQNYIEIPYFKHESEEFIKNIKLRAKRDFLDVNGKNLWRGLRKENGFMIIIDFNKGIKDYFEFLKEKIGHFDYKILDDRHIKLLFESPKCIPEEFRMEKNIKITPIIGGWIICYQRCCILLYGELVIEEKGAQNVENL